MNESLRLQESGDAESLRGGPINVDHGSGHDFEGIYAFIRVVVANGVQCAASFTTG